MDAFMVSENLKEKILEMFLLPFSLYFEGMEGQNYYEFIGFDEL